MSPNNEPELHSVDHNLVDTQDTDAMQTPSALQALPVELIGMLSEFLDNEDLLAMRTTCRELRDGSSLELCHRLFELDEISGTRKTVQELATILTSPNFTHAKKTFTELCVTMGVLGSYEKYEAPHPADVTRLLRAIPGLTTANFMDDSGISKRPQSSIFFACMAQLPSQVRRLGLLEVQVDGDLLADMLEAYSNDLRSLVLMEVTPDSLSGWLRVMRALLSTRIAHLELTGLKYVDVDQKAGTAGVPKTGYVMARQGGVKPTLEFILQHLEKLL